MMVVIKMADQTTKTINNTSNREVTIRQITVPDQELRPVREAYGTAKSLHGELAGFIDTVMNRTELERAKKEVYLLAVAHNGLPEIAGWYQVYRETARFNPMSDEDATGFMNEGRWDEVLYVNQNAVNAAKESRPLVLRVYYDCMGMVYLYADDWPGYVARVALVKPEVARMLRLGDGEIL